MSTGGSRVNQSTGAGQSLWQEARAELTHLALKQAQPEISWCPAVPSSEDGGTPGAWHPSLLQGTQSITSAAQPAACSAVLYPVLLRIWLKKY